MLRHTYYSQNYASIIGISLDKASQLIVEGRGRRYAAGDHSYVVLLSFPVQQVANYFPRCFL